MRQNLSPFAVAFLATAVFAGESFAQRGGIRVNVRTGGNNGGFRGNDFHGDGFRDGYRGGYRNEGISVGINNRGGSFVRYNDGNVRVSVGSRPNYYGNRYYYGGRAYNNYYGPRLALDVARPVPGDFTNATSNPVDDASIQPDPASDSTALLTILVPTPDAELIFDGVPANERGPEREFRTPAIEKGQSFSYELKTRWIENGREVERAKKVSFKAGDTILVDLREDEPKPEVKPQGNQRPVPPPPPKPSTSN